MNMIPLSGPQAIDSTVHDQLRLLLTDLSSRTIVTGGDYVTRGAQSPALNAGTVESFQVTLQAAMMASQRDQTIHPGILINDLGLACDLDACTIGDPRPLNTELPEQYLTLLREAGISVATLEVFWERHIRNRTKKLFARARRERAPIAQADDGWWLAGPDGQRYLLTRTMANDPTGSPACPLIMAAYAFEQQRRGYESSVNVYYVDKENVENIVNHFMIEKGAAVARLLGLKLQIRNVYFTNQTVFVGPDATTDLSR